MNEENKKSEYVTKKVFEDVIAEQTQVILLAMESRFSGIDNRLGEVRDELKHDINNVQTLIDSYVKSQEDMRQEFIIMKEELRKIKKIIKEKFGLEIGVA